MISIGRLGGFHLDYYTRELAQGREGYYISPELPGRWWGELAEALGLAGVVDRDDLRAMFDGVDPRGGSVLRSSRVERVAFDLTLSVPKTVSLLWALGDDTTAAAVVTAVEHANEVALEFLQREAVGVRRGHAGRDRLAGEGLIVARFRHVASRAGDPQLHIHNVVANLTRGADGRWSAIDSSQLYQWGFAAGHLFEAVLRHDLTTGLGVTFRSDRRGIFEIPSVPLAVRTAFSQRRTQIQDYMDERGWTSRKASDWANLDTRQAKNPDISVAELRAGWRAKALGLGFDIRRAMTRRAVSGPAVSEVQATDEMLARTLTESDATFNRRDVYVAVAMGALNGATVDDIEDRVARFLGSGTAIPVNDRCWTTREMLDLEHGTVAIALAGLGIGAGVAQSAEVVQAIDRRASLSDEQAAMVRHICTSGNRYDTVIGRAGSGKTFSLDAARDAWERSGLVVVGAAPSAVAASELTVGAGIEATSADRLLNRLDRRRLRLDHTYVIVLDEAAMLGTRRLARLVAHVEQAGAKLVAIGDTKQLPAVDAAGLYAAIGRRCGYVQLSENHRQHDPEERRSLIDLRACRSAEAVTRMDRNGQITVAENADQLRDILIADWAALRAEGVDVVMLTRRRQDTADLNRRARAALRAAGHVGEVVARVDDTEFAVGDRVVAHRNRYDLGILNAHQGTITGVDDGRVLVALDAGHSVRLPSDYLEAGHLTHGYASTVHKNQGITCDVALVLGDEGLFNELGYTGLSRGRDANRLYLVRSHREHDHGLDHLEPDPLAAVVRALERRQAKTAAIDRSIGLGR